MFVLYRIAQVGRRRTLVVMMDFSDRDALVEYDPGTYHLKEHYSRTHGRI